MNARLARPSFLLMLALCVLPGVSVACSSWNQDQSLPFAEELKLSSHVVIVRVQAQQLLAEPEGQSPSRKVKAIIRIVEVLAGDRPSLESISYFSSWCGGHRLDVGGYYVVLLRDARRELELPFAGQLVAGLGDEYSEPMGDNGTSTLLMYLRNFSKGAQLPAAFDTKPYLDLARMPSQAPSFEVDRK